MISALSSGRVPDPAKAHGAWVYLLVSVLAGALTAAGIGFLPALFSGLAFAGVFLLASSVALGWPKGARRMLTGAVIALSALVLALALGADRTFFVYGLTALFPAAMASWFAHRRGFLSPAALSFGVAALVVAAPCAACAGGASAAQSWFLLLLLAPFFAWRTVRIRRMLDEQKGWGRADLRKQGMREAGLSVVWTFLAVLVVHLLG
jgi:hypothetical protein